MSVETDRRPAERLTKRNDVPAPVENALGEAIQELAGLLSGERGELSNIAYRNLRDRREDPNIAPYWNLIEAAGIIDPRDQIAMRRARSAAEARAEKAGAAGRRRPIGDFQRNLLEKLRHHQEEHPDEPVVLADFARRTGHRGSQTRLAYHRLEERIRQEGGEPLPPIRRPIREERKRNQKQNELPRRQEPDADLDRRIDTLKSVGLEEERITDILARNLNLPKEKVKSRLSAQQRGSRQSTRRNPRSA